MKSSGGEKKGHPARAPRNRTLNLTPGEKKRFFKLLLRNDLFSLPFRSFVNRTILGDCKKILPLFPDSSIDLIFADPPYNLDKNFNGHKFLRQSELDYENWLHGWLPELNRILKPEGSIYLCCDWRSSPTMYTAASKYFKPRNRITWEREKGRGAKKNWKNCSEDIWYLTKSDRYVFHLNEIKIKRRVIAPYRDRGGKPRDWTATPGGDFRLTHPSNIWTDITVPFWSMFENTNHPTQKPEKLLAKIILASSNRGDIILDPFLGSGTTSVTAKKLGRSYIGIEIDENFSCIAEKRLYEAETRPEIQGYYENVFWERNSLPERKKTSEKKSALK